jgi:hypothetical protein
MKDFMPSEHSIDVKFEIGHALFNHIVGYSRLLIAEQSERIRTLKKMYHPEGHADARGHPPDEMDQLMVIKR